MGNIIHSTRHSEASLVFTMVPISLCHTHSQWKRKPLPAAPRCGVSAHDRVDQGHDLDPVDFSLIAKKFVESFVIGNGVLSSSNFETADFSETLDWGGYFCNREQLFRSCYRRLIAVS